MYKVYCDGQLLFDPRVDELKITDKKLMLEVNKTGGFDFTIYPTHPLYENIYKLKSIIEVYQDDTLLFYGRVLDDDIGFYNDKKVKCEGALGYLNDSVIRPYEFNGSVSDYINMIISQHNDQVDDYKKLYVGNITIQDDNDYIVRSDATHTKTWDVITNKVIKSFNGYLHFRRENNVNYIDFLQDSTFYSNQKIEFRENLLDLTRTRKGSAIVTAVIPKGARIEDDEGSESYVDITSVNNGVDYIYNQEAVDAYGWVYETVEFSDVTLPSNLKTKAEAYLSEAIKTPVTIELKAIDKSMSDVNFDELNYFEYVEVKSVIHDIDDYYLIKKLSIDMENPANNTIVVGAEYRVFTDQKISTDNKINEIVNTIESNRDRWQNVTEDSYPNIKPEIPTGFSVTAGFKTIQISWDYSNSINVKKYELYADKSIDYITQPQNLIFEGDSSGYSHVVETNETWYYTLRAVNHRGRPSDFTTIVSASTVKIITDDMMFGSVNADILADLAVDASKLTDRSVTAEKIANLAVGNAAIANGAITNAKIGTLAVSTGQIQNAAITNAKIANLAVDSAKIADLAITNAKIADASITNAKISDLSAEKIKTGTLSAIDISGVNILGSYIEGGTIKETGPDTYIELVDDGLFVKTTNGDVPRISIETDINETSNVFEFPALIWFEKSVLDYKFAVGTGAAGLGDGFIGFTEAAPAGGRVFSLLNSGGTIDVSADKILLNASEIDFLGSRSIKMDNFGNFILPSEFSEYTNWNVQNASGETSFRVYASTGNVRVDKRTDFYDFALFRENASILKQLQVGTNLFVDNQLNVTGNTYLNGPVVSEGINNETTSLAANVRISGGVLYRSTSASKYKTDILPVETDFHRILSVKPKSWYDKAEIARNNGSKDGLWRHHGVIAEDLVDAGLDEFVSWENGEPEGVQYDRLAIYLFPIVKELLTRVDELERVIT